MKAVQMVAVAGVVAGAGVAGITPAEAATNHATQDQVAPRSVIYTELFKGLWECTGRAAAVAAQGHRITESCASVYVSLHHFYRLTYI
ncbi:hypothetical protein [Kribbella sp. NPDC048928]|uniref:hypothetical protein n=1 Tax=Kribbella sp. NPDC048928 TaxID=3364111 RepID=UPI0037187F49